MKVNLVKKTTIEGFVKQNARSRSSFNIWLNTIKFVDWNKPEDISNTFGSADLLGNSSNRVIFNIGGNNYRIICKYLFGSNKAHLFIKWIGPHAEYDQLCQRGLQYTIDEY